MDIVNKSSIVFKVVSKEVFELRLRHRVFGLGVTFMLILSQYQCFVEKQSGKMNLIKFIGLSGFKVIIILLAELIVI